MEARLKSNRSRVLDRIAAAALAAGRNPADVELVAVTKGVQTELAAQLIALGCQSIGESRIPELEEKRRAWLTVGYLARWHFVGHLQRNKARRAVRCAHVIHSIDSEALWETLARVAEEEKSFPAIYLQVKLAHDPAKGGLAPEEVGPLVERARSGPLPLLGLMTIAPQDPDPERARVVARSVFERASALARELPASAFSGGRVRLSMGMTQDFEEAIRAGAHVVRIGSALFEGIPASVRAGEESAEAEEESQA